MSAFFIYCLSTLMAQFGSQQCSKLLELVEYGFHNLTLFFICSQLLFSFLDDLHELFFKIYFIFNCGVSSLSAHVVSVCVCACVWFVPMRLDAVPTETRRGHQTRQS